MKTTLVEMVKRNRGVRESGEQAPGSTMTCRETSKKLRRNLFITPVEVASRPESVAQETTTSAETLAYEQIEDRHANGATAQTRHDPDGDAQCWLCLEQDSSLERPCNCPRYSHPVCLARWQVRCAGEFEETRCRFCKCSLPDWRKVLPCAPANVEIRVVCGGKTHRLVSRPGDSYENFQSRVWSVCGLPSGTPLELSFNFNDPFSGDAITVKGSGAYNAAVHCGAITMKKQAMPTSPPPASR